MNFGQALEALKVGEKVVRSGWNGKGMWIVLVDNWFYGGKAAEYIADHAEANGLFIQGSCFIAIKTVDNYFVPWLASQTDTLAEDWTIV